VDVILGFAGSTTGAGMKRKDWKWIDLNFFLQLLLGGKSVVQQLLLVLLSIPPLVFLTRAWWGLDRNGERYRTLVWAAAITWTMVVNLYVGMYDTVLMVIAVLQTADVVRSASPLSPRGRGDGSEGTTLAKTSPSSPTSPPRGERGERAEERGEHCEAPSAYPTAFRNLVFVVFLTAWVAQPLAIAMLALTGERSAIQIYTIALAAFGIYQLIQARRFAKAES
jgi:hypothetical protein